MNIFWVGSTGSDPLLVSHPCDIRTPNPYRNVVSTYRNIDETAILKEISKSYILIPKKHSVSESNNTYSIPATSSVTNLSNDTDWKSKYDILNELKQNDKDEYIKKHRDAPQTLSLSERLYDKYDFPEKDNNSNKQVNINEPHSEQINALNNEDQPRKTNEYQPQQINKYTCNETFDAKNHSLEDEKGHVASKDTDLHKKIGNDTTQDTGKLMSELDVVVNNENSLLKLDNQFFDTDHDKTNELENNDINDELNQSNQDIQFKKKENDILDNFAESVNQKSKDLETKISYDNKDEYTDLNDQSRKDICQPISTPDKKQHEINILTLQNSDSNDNKKDKFESTERIEENVENVIKTQDIKKDDNNLEIVETSKGFEESILIGSSEQFQTNVETTDLLKDTNENDTSQIKEYEDEQKNMFYSDNPNENYAYNEELGGNATENENYENNEQYSYYEAVKDQANYGTEINEHLESTERYDPNYEQQYENQYDGNPTQYQNENYEQVYYNVEEQNQDYQQEQYQNYDPQNYEQPYHQSDNPVAQPQYDNVYDNHTVEQENPNIEYEQDIMTTQISNDEPQVERQVDIGKRYDNDETGNEIIETVSPAEISQAGETTTDTEIS
ncbi:GATA zinc finger domain-containing protein 14-like [Zerene cesonia]|uniref:GATA zinc finger domain-containing protein 14-like n=1 Tax=Zerene cesonia TaxID=33412 RepID=UPI0018E5A0A7|nr:GATA zinc finger domain-containing protein 14-like [Zerene cesonia]